MSAKFTERPESNAEPDAPQSGRTRFLVLLTGGLGLPALLGLIGLFADLGQISTLSRPAAVTALGLLITLTATAFAGLMATGKLRSSRLRHVIAGATVVAGLAISAAPSLGGGPDVRRPATAEAAAPKASGSRLPATVQKGRSTGVLAEFDLSMKPGHGYDLDRLPGDPATKNSGWSGKDSTSAERDIYLSGADTSLYGYPHTEDKPGNLVKQMREEDPPHTCETLPDGTGAGGILAVEDLRVGDRICTLTYENRWAMLRIDGLPNTSHKRLDTHIWLLED